RRHTRWPRDWSSDVCSSDLSAGHHAPRSRWTQVLASIGFVARDGRRRGLSRSVKPGRIGLEMRDALLAGYPDTAIAVFEESVLRSEERRVGKECRIRWSTND